MRPSRLAAACLVLPLALAPAAARAQSDDSAVEQLIQILVKNGVLTRTQADGLAAQARAEARAAHPPAPTPASGGPAGHAAPAAPRPVAPGTVRVTYVPETVRKQIAAEVKQQVMQQATEEGWAEPNSIPAWTQRVRVTGDVRLRGELDMFPKGNYDAFPDFNAINSSANGYDSLSGVNPPLLNTTQNRARMLLRARIGVTAQLADWVDTELRIATGNDRNPVSNNQTLGAGGDFSKYALWLDRADITLRPDDALTLYAGRFGNPFWSSDLLFWEDLNFDGLAVRVHEAATPALGGTLVFGAFPLFSTDFGFGSTSIDKTASRNSWLFAAQLAGDWKPEEKAYSTRLAVGYFDFVNVQGETSQLCVAPTSYGSCNTDDTRAAWIEYGNTVFPVRNIATTSATTAQPQYYGLASRFGVLDVHGQLVYTGFSPVDIRPEADFVTNLGFNQAAIDRLKPVNNLGGNNVFVGSGSGYMVRVTIGHQALQAAGDWNVSLAYKYLGSDAVIDALTDPNFHMGGTNAKGYVVTGNLALSRDLWLAARWYSASQISGPPYAADTLLFDLNARF